ncbi:zinc finger protein 34-like [Anopheles merus]|uniref:Zinc finger protein 865 n=1 Tax=Anopheles merus TaxID=30066 RepID=A0A182UYQ5_ANOME|nr:zinc finger protein 34-like [Anopheles merus]
MDMKDEEYPSSAAFEPEWCRICVSEPEAIHGMDEMIDADQSVSLNMMLEAMFPMFASPEGKDSPNTQQHLPTKACDSCKHKIMIAYGLYLLLIESEERLQRYLGEAARSCTDDEKAEQSCEPYEVLIECSFDDGETALSREEEPPALRPLEALDGESGPRKRGRPRTRPLPQTATVLVEEEKRPKRMSKQDRINESVMEEEPMVLEEDIVLLDESTGEQTSQPVAKKRGRKPKVRVESTDQLDESTTEQAIEPPVAKKRGRKPKVRAESIDKLDDSTAEQSVEPPVAKKRGRKPKIKPEPAEGDESSTEGRKERKQSATIKVEAAEYLSDQGGSGVELESKVDVYNCQLCEGHTYGSPTELTDHLKAEHPDLIRTCDKCPKVFMTEAAYQHHQYCHATLRSYFCMFCDKGFQTENLLKSHTKSHTEMAEFLCSLCGKKFNNKSNLRQHLVRHTGVKPWACTQCPSRFCTKGALNLHQRTHSKLRPFSCDICGSQFHTRYSLIKHQLIHTGERPYSCDLCPMRFVSTYHVKRHMLTHTGEKPFKCTYCERSFAQSNDMVKHMKTHVGENPYQCDRCEASFRLLTDLRNHYKETCTPVDKGAGSSADEGKAIRFTSTSILKMRYEKEMGQYSEQRYEESAGQRKVMAEATEFPAME